MEDSKLVTPEVGIKTQSSCAINAVSPKIPQFWNPDPQLWFAQVEQQFLLAGTTQSSTKFSHVVSALPPGVASEVRDIILSPPTKDPYETLRKTLLARMVLSETQRFRPGLH